MAKGLILWQEEGDRDERKVLDYRTTNEEHSGDISLQNDRLISYRES